MVLINNHSRGAVCIKYDLIYSNPAKKIQKMPKNGNFGVKRGVILEMAVEGHILWFDHSWGPVSV